MTPTESPCAVFTYGTLKRGELNHELVSPYARSIERGWIEGTLFDIGLFPALAEGEGQVRGEIVRLDTRDVPEVLSLLDRLEGCWPDDPTRSLYLRRVVEVTTDGGEREPAYAYFYNVDHQDLPPLETLPRVESGEWSGTPAEVVRSESDVLEVFGEHVRTFRHEVGEEE